MEILFILGTGQSNEQTATRNFGREKELVIALLKKDKYSRDDVHAGTVLYSPAIYKDQLTSNKEYLVKRILEYINLNGNDVTNGLNEALRVFKASNQNSKAKSIVLFTDQNLDDMAKDALVSIKDNGMEVVVVTLGKNKKTVDDKFLKENRIPLVIDNDDSLVETVENIDSKSGKGNSSPLIVNIFLECYFGDVK